MERSALMQLGTVLSVPGAFYAELLARHFDFVWIDLEHGALGAADMQDAVIGVQSAGSAALVRIPADASFAPCLDAGADGVVIPRVRSLGEAEAIVRRLRHAPEGVRGYGPRRLAIWPRAEQPVCALQIEDLAGVHAAAEIARVPGIDALVVGMADLSFELGEPLVLDAPPLRSAIDAVRAAAAAAGVRFGLAGLPVEAVADAGADLVVVGSDVRLLDGALAAAVAAARAGTGARG
jgi:2-keto-3-deoxy-L-rhamnonate aldolase RhmA